MSLRVYLFLMLVLAALGAANTFLPQGEVVQALSQGPLPAPKAVMALATAGMLFFIYGGLGFLGLRLAERLGFADVWDSGVGNTQRIVIPALVGIGVGVFFVAAQSLFSLCPGWQPLPHPPFPTSLVAAATAAIGEETLFRLFLIPFWVWVISHVILRGKGQGPVFWGVATLSALAFAAAHLPGLMVIEGLQSISDVPVVILAEIVLLNGVLSMLAAHYLRKSGFLAAVGIHFWADVIWHVLFGLL